MDGGRAGVLGVFDRMNRIYRMGEGNPKAAGSAIRCGAILLSCLLPFL
jgi:hypothetical protein